MIQIAALFLFGILAIGLDSCKQEASKSESTKTDIIEVKKDSVVVTKDTVIIKKSK